MFCKANYDDYNQLGKIVTQSLKDTYGIGMFRYQDKNEMLRQYNLLGDPSLFVRGIAPFEQLEFKNNEEFHNGDKINYTCRGTINQESSFKVDAGSIVELEAKEKIKLTSGFKVEKGANFKAVIK